MKAKEQRLVVTFHATTETMTAEKELKLNQIAGRPIPVPRQISAGRSLVWSVPAAGEEAVRTCMERYNLARESMGICLIQTIRDHKNYLNVTYNSRK